MIWNATFGRIVEIHEIHKSKREKNHTIAFSDFHKEITPVSEYRSLCCNSCPKLGITQF